jgi:hypothetical protein
VLVKPSNMLSGQNLVGCACRKRDIQVHVGAMLKDAHLKMQPMFGKRRVMSGKSFVAQPANTQMLRCNTPFEEDQLMVTDLTCSSMLQLHSGKEVSLIYFLTALRQHNTFLVRVDHRALDAQNLRRLQRKIASLST